MKYILDTYIKLKQRMVLAKGAEGANLLVAKTDMEYFFRTRG